MDLQDGLSYRANKRTFDYALPKWQSADNSYISDTSDASAVNSSDIFGGGDGS